MDKHKTLSNHSKCQSDIIQSASYNTKTKMHLKNICLYVMSIIDLDLFFQISKYMYECSTGDNRNGRQAELPMCCPGYQYDLTMTQPSCHSIPSQLPFVIHKFHKGVFIIKLRGRGGPGFSAHPLSARQNFSNPPLESQQF